MFQFGVRNSGHAPRGTGPTGRVTEQWRFQTDDEVRSSPAVANGTVYVGSDDGRLYALAAGDGTKQWHFQTDGEVFSSPAVVDGTVYIGSRDGNVYALNASDGSKQWVFATDRRISSSPVVVDGTVYIGSGVSVYAIDAGEGTERWHYQTNDIVESSPAVVDGTVYVGSDDGHLYALATSDGTERWRFETRESKSVVPSPAVVDNTVYVHNSYDHLHALAASDGTEQWHITTDYFRMFSSPAVADGTIYVGMENSAVHAVATDNSSLQWRFETNDVITTSSPAVADGTVYIGTRGDDRVTAKQVGNVYALDADEGTEQWHFQTDGHVFSSPAVVDGTVYIGSSDGNVYALTEGQTAETAIEKAWEQTYGDNGFDSAFSVIETSDSSYLFAGGTSSAGNGVSTWLVKIDETGTKRWERTYGAGIRVGRPVIETSDGGSLAVGYTHSTGSGNIDGWLLKVAQDGTRQWEQTYGGGEDDQVLWVTETNDGDYLFAGRTQSQGSGKSDAWLVKANQDGNEQWEKTYGGDGTDFASSVIETSDGNYLFGGSTQSRNGAWLVKVAPDGSKLWDKTFFGKTGTTNLIETNDGGYLAAGLIQSSENRWKTGLVKVDRDGTKQWKQTYDNEVGNLEWDIVRTPVVETNDGGYLIASPTSSNSSQSTYDAWLLKTGGDGTKQWSETYGGSGNDIAFSLIKTSDRGYLFAGATKSSGSSGWDAWLVKLGG